MTPMQQIANNIPSDIRQKIMLEWIPGAQRVAMDNPFYKMLFEAYYIYVEPNGIRKDNCPKCLRNVYENWQALVPMLKEAEKENKLLDAL